MYLTKKYVYTKLSDQVILWVNPRRISGHVGTKWPVTKKAQVILKSLPNIPRVSFKMLKVLMNYDPYIIPGKFYRDPYPVEEMEKYNKIKDLIENRDNLTSTYWYKKLIEEFESDGVARHKIIEMHSEDEIIEFFHDYVFDLVDSMAATGYDMNKGMDIGAALVDKDGSIHKAGSGNHRFMVARIVGTPRIPVKIAGIHREWYQSRKTGNGNQEIEQLAGVLNEIEQTNQ